MFYCEYRPTDRFECLLFPPPSQSFADPSSPPPPDLSVEVLLSRFLLAPHRHARAEAGHRVGCGSDCKRTHRRSEPSGLITGGTYTSGICSRLISARYEAEQPGAGLSDEGQSRRAALEVQQRGQSFGVSLLTAAARLGSKETRRWGVTFLRVSLHTQTAFLQNVFVGQGSFENTFKRPIIHLCVVPNTHFSASCKPSWASSFQSWDLDPVCV